MQLIDLQDQSPENDRIYLVLIKQVFSLKNRKAYASWSENGFILEKTVLFNDEYICGFYVE